MTDLTVLQLNIWMSGTKVSGGLDRVADVIRRTGADVVLTTESTPDAVATLRGKLGAGWFSAADPAGSGILARWGCELTGRSTYYTAAKVSHPARALSVYSIHLEYRYYTPFLYRGYGGAAMTHPTGRYGWDQMPAPLVDEEELAKVNTASGRPDVAADIANRMRADVEAGRIVIGGGDFNEPSHLDYTIGAMYDMDHYGVTRVWESTKALEDAGFMDAYRQRYPNPVSDPGVTWPVAVDGHDPGALSWAPGADVRDRIDFVFYDPAQAQVLSAQIVGPADSVSRRFRAREKDAARFRSVPGVWPSDHRGNLVKLRY